MSTSREEKQICAVISEEELRLHLNELHEDFKRVCNDHDKGFLTREELYSHISNLLYEGFYRFLQRNEMNKKYRISIPIAQNFTSLSYERFIEEYGMWKKKEPPQSDKGEKYLYYSRSAPEYGIKYKDEASVSDKTSFFELIDSFRLPLDYFEPLPKGCPEPDYHEYPSGIAEHYISIRFNCEDDLGLMFDKTEAIGKEYVLTDSYRLKAELQITDTLSGNKRVGEPETGYKAIGTVEGYTSARKREIEVVKYEKDAYIHLITLLGKDDIEEFNKYPLWDNYRKHIKKKNDLYHQAVKAIVDML